MLITVTTAGKSTGAREMFDQPDNDPNYYLHPNELCHHCGAMPDEDGCPECSEPDIEDTWPIDPN